MSDAKHFLMKGVMYTSLYFLYFGVILTKCFWSRCFVSYYTCILLFVYLYVNESGSITSVGEERANLSAVVYP